MSPQFKTRQDGLRARKGGWFCPTCLDSLKKGSRCCDQDVVYFASKKEKARYSALLWKQKTGEISDLSLQPRFDLIVEKQNCGFYKADFKYQNGREWIYEDTKSKGSDDGLSKLKRKLVKAIYGVEVILT